MTGHEHDERRSAATRPRVQRHADEDAPAHPLLDLQQQAGNSAVAQLLAVQRHSLDPEEEAGS